MYIKPTSPTSFVHVLALKATRSHRNVKVNPNPILRHLIIRLSFPSVSPVHTSITRTMTQQEPQRLGRFGVIGTARTAHHCPDHRAAFGQVAAEIAGAVAGRVAALGKPLAEDGFRLDDHVGSAAVEEEVLVLRGQIEVCAGVEAEGSGGTEVVAVVAVPHERVDDEDVGIGPVVYCPNRVPSGRRSEI